MIDTIAQLIGRRVYSKGIIPALQCSNFSINKSGPVLMLEKKNYSWIDVGAFAFAWINSAEGLRIVLTRFYTNMYSLIKILRSEMQQGKSLRFQVTQSGTSNPCIAKVILRLLNYLCSRNVGNKVWFFLHPQPGEWHFPYSDRSHWQWHQSPNARWALLSPDPLTQITWRWGIFSATYRKIINKTWPSDAVAPR